MSESVHFLMWLNWINSNQSSIYFTATLISLPFWLDWLILAFANTGNIITNVKIKIFRKHCSEHVITFYMMAIKSKLQSHCAGGLESKRPERWTFSGVHPRVGFCLWLNVGAGMSGWVSGSLYWLISVYLEIAHWLLQPQPMGRILLVQTHIYALC